MQDTDKTREQLIAELSELRQQVVDLRSGEAKNALQAHLARLASFPEQNPNPVIETDLEGKVTYLNPRAKERFPDLETSGLQHPVLQDLKSMIGTLKQGKEESLLRELEIDNRIYQQKTTYMAENSPAYLLSRHHGTQAAPGSTPGEFIGTGRYSSEPGGCAEAAD